MGKGACLRRATEGTNSQMRAMHERDLGLLSIGERHGGMFRSLRVTSLAASYQRTDVVT